MAMKQDKIIFALTSNPKLAKKVSETLDIELGKSQIERFSDGEIICRCLSEVRNKTVYLIQSTSYPQIEKIFEILVFVDALKNKGAKEIVLVIPYYGYSRQDRVAKEGEPITAKMVASLYQNAGINKIITIDLHTPGIKDFFNIPVTNINPTKLFADYFRAYFDERGIKNEDLVIVTPDHGSNTRVKEIAQYFEGSSLVFVEKRRPVPNESKIISIVGNPRDKYCLLLDDIIDTGGTINHVVDALLKKNAKEVYVGATHGIFSKGGLDSRIKHIVVSDTIEKNIEGVRVISVDKLISKEIEG
mgnify:CR=1 FL=1